MEHQLSIVLGTYNRLDQLQRCVESIVSQTKTAFRLYVTDAGSTDGTVEYLQSIAGENIIPVLVGKKLGQAKAYNDVFNIVTTPYVCWLSDDNEVIDHGLDRAVSIIRTDPSIGMVALKTKDLQGPFVDAPFIGGVSSTGILNVNQGLLPTALLKKIGGFSEEFRDYGIDNALTAEVLFAGYKVVYSRKVALQHYRNWSEDPTSENYQWLKQRHEAAKVLYEERYGNQNTQELSGSYRMKTKVARRVKAGAKRYLTSDYVRTSAAVRTCFIILSSRYISILDPILTFGRDYHLVQKRRTG
ncbi:glycosyltransferase [Rhizobium leguminosarum]|uniref:glycosyltransferase family 2 protein n=1 Tax=Rhizobium leguminosarum TaxID=384 RepID=UPI001C93CB1B|nr:glycosyltransferase [Rhizobium leguminosarum]MBY5684909.1 glycosyltransferase [Rhizobium leguminosarum]MBY5744962.1 glycosyltransferase [Rhizobium leguminosarum]